MALYRKTSAKVGDGCHMMAFILHTGKPDVFASSLIDYMSDNGLRMQCYRYKKEKKEKYLTHT
jgi:hypothetical protein